MSNPKVSVLTPVFNTHTDHLRQCIDSILNQTFTDFEFIILNDSPDNIELEQLILSYTDKRIKYHKNDKNIGISESRNKLLSLACGEYIAIFDHDDISVPDRLSCQVEYMDKHPEIGVVGGWLQNFESNEGIFITPEKNEQIKIALTEDCFIAHTSSMIRKSVLDKNKIKYEGNKVEVKRKFQGSRLAPKISIKKRSASRNTSKQNIYKEIDDATND